MRKLILETEDGVGAIPVGARLIYQFGKLEMIGTHFRKFGDHFSSVHPLTIGLTRKAADELKAHPDCDRHCGLELVVKNLIHIRPYIQ